MNCIEARRMVTPYVNKKLSDKETEAFLDHIENCSDCMDELDIYFTVYRALNSLDTGEHHEFDFKKMLEEDIRMERRAIFRRKAVALIRVIIMFAAEILLLLSVYTGCQLKKGETTFGAIQRAIYQIYARPSEKLANQGRTLEKIKDVSEKEEQIQKNMTEEMSEEK